MEQENKIMIGRIAAAFVLTVAGAFLPDAWSGEGVTLEYRLSPPVALSGGLSDRGLGHPAEGGEKYPEGSGSG